ncbi:hypothetical protein [Sphingomicrobium sediminis]|uniref:Lipoprotein n=1 Tax=Sphingomicrobium sediminis TaxID=2950949 RepID=A0A9X2EMX0_9SPHN|nr:hypothetical protein [Sphingomicrobium sediminis]MCM8558349.1 hypothetical protein [Sphingomicrobium sediminis]
MTRFLIIAASLTLAACGGSTTSQVRPAFPQTSAPPPAPTVQAFGPLIGSSAATLAARFGEPALRIAEGNSLMLQYKGGNCVLDAYLYPGTSGAMQVTHIDTRDTSGLPAQSAGCIRAIEQRR